MNGIPPHGSERPQRGQRKGAGVKVFRDLIVARTAVIDCHGSKRIGVIRSHARKTAVHSGPDREGQSSLQGQDAVHLPAT